MFRSCLRCRGYLIKGQYPARASCVNCGTVVYDSRPRPMSRLDLDVPLPVATLEKCRDCGREWLPANLNGPTAWRCPECRQTVRMEQKAARLREFRARRRVDAAATRRWARPGRAYWEW